MTGARRAPLTVGGSLASAEADRSVEARLRAFLLAISAAALAGTMVELWLMDHTGELLQVIPFGLCAAGLGAVLAVLLRPSRATVWTLRAVMLLVAFGGALGMYEHLIGNYEFERDIRPRASMLEVGRRALHGAAPALAPAGLAMVSALAIAATYAHPMLASHGESGGRRGVESAQ